MSDTTTSQPATPATPETPAATTATPTPTPAPSPGSTPAPTTTQAAQPATPQEPVYALTLPDGSPLEASAVERVTTFAKDSKLAPEAAQKVLELAHAESHAVVQRQVSEYTAKVTKWESDVKADPELGGQNHTRTLTRVKSVMDRFGNPELTKAFKETGFGNYPALVKFVEKIGAAMEADQIARPTGNAEPDANYLDRMFPTSAAK